MFSPSVRTASPAARASTPTSGRGSDDASAPLRRLHADRDPGGDRHHRRDGQPRGRAADPRPRGSGTRGERAPRAALARGARRGDPARAGVRLRRQARVLPLPAPGAQRPAQGHERRRSVPFAAHAAGHRDRSPADRGRRRDPAGWGGVPAKRRAAGVSHRAQERQRALERRRRPRRDHTRAGRLMNRARRAAGFTLVEILVALAVLAIALTATARSLGGALDTTAALRDRTLARWVAEGRLASLELRGGVAEL